MAGKRGGRGLPGGLGTAGAALWRKLTESSVPGEQIVFSTGELVTLELACRQADDIARLEKLLHDDGLTVTGSKGQVKLSSVPAELRLQRAALARLVGLLAIPDEDEGEGRSPAQRKAQRAADVRWACQAHAREVRKHG